MVSSLCDTIYHGRSKGELLEIRRRSSVIRRVGHGLCLSVVSNVIDNNELTVGTGGLPCRIANTALTSVGGSVLPSVDKECGWKRCIHVCDWIRTMVEGWVCFIISAQQIALGTRIFMFIKPAGHKIDRSPLSDQCRGRALVEANETRGLQAARCVA